MAGSVERTVSEDVPATPCQVRDHYVDLDNIKDVHPLVGLGRHAAPQRLRPRVRAGLPRPGPIPLGFATLPIRYTATLQVPRSGPVLTEARSSPGCAWTASSPSIRSRQAPG